MTFHHGSDLFCLCDHCYFHCCLMSKSHPNQQMQYSQVKCSQSCSSYSHQLMKALCYYLNHQSGLDSYRKDCLSYPRFVAFRWNQSVLITLQVACLMFVGVKRSFIDNFAKIIHQLWFVQLFLSFKPAVDEIHQLNGSIEHGCSAVSCMGWSLITDL